jgi:hypothetical protein
MIMSIIACSIFAIAGLVLKEYSFFIAGYISAHVCIAADYIVKAIKGAEK